MTKLPDHELTTELWSLHHALVSAELEATAVYQKRHEAIAAFAKGMLAVHVALTTKALPPLGPIKALLRWQWEPCGYDYHSLSQDTQDSFTQEEFAACVGWLQEGAEE